MGACQSGDAETRARYIEALRAADNHDIKLLLIFARFIVGIITRDLARCHERY